LKTISLRMPRSYCIKIDKRKTLGISMGQKRNQFWKTKSLKEMTRAEWESLCDHCGLCCLHSVQDGKTGKIKLLAVACQYLDTSTCRCLIYEDRSKTEPDCKNLTPENFRRIKKLPYSCAYRSLVDGRELKWWHPLMSGDPNTVHEADISVQGKIVTAEHVDLDDLKYFNFESTA
jgi:uncharacterized cysteine cluster protein YcgN (CxxCxxCC family)